MREWDEYEHLIVVLNELTFIMPNIKKYYITSLSVRINRKNQLLLPFFNYVTKTKTRAILKHYGIFNGYWPIVISLLFNFCYCLRTGDLQVVYTRGLHGLNNLLKIKETRLANCSYLGMKRVRNFLSEFLLKFPHLFSRCSTNISFKKPIRVEKLRKTPNSLF